MQNAWTWSAWPDTPSPDAAHAPNATTTSAPKADGNAPSPATDAHTSGLAAGSSVRSGNEDKV